MWMFFIGLWAPAFLYHKFALFGGRGKYFHGNFLKHPGSFRARASGPKSALIPTPTPPLPPPTTTAMNDDDGEDDGEDLCLRGLFCPGQGSM